ncbi:UNVERIFIED_ORG: isocitrate/isopropylmalate dehydrogenase [Burkholderia sp. 1595]|uniref:Isocitrate/isopropylmalate dehydrogenase n=1 Tax=Paraburkholderia terricola TaxID=169427 RepID=A0ABU1M2H5_9BURK|nr:isocitrate/isopropylmalate dehydrogenase [Paraburkholderia terricola]MDR6484867.1 isocitrate/isopropylmalate dehydrogenase [Paraburkholderia terricola]
MNKVLKEIGPSVALCLLGSDLGRVKRYLKTGYFCVFTQARSRPLRPEQAILGLRKHLALFANLRPAMLYREL